MIIGVYIFARYFSQNAKVTTTLPTPLAQVQKDGSGNITKGGGVKTNGVGIKTNVDSIKVTKCYYDVDSGQMLIKASSSDVTAHLYVYLPDRTYKGEVQNGGGNRYGGTPLGYIPHKDPGTIIIVSSSGGSISVPTTPFQP